MTVLWEPDDAARTTSRMARFRDRHVPGGDYAALWQWSVDHPGDFWTAVVADLDLPVRGSLRPALADAAMPGATWFPNATLNHAEAVLAGGGLADDDVVVVAHSQSRDPVSLTLAQVRGAVGACAAGLRRLGVGRGDRVAAYLPNIPETWIAFLATASLGAVWSSCAPEFGTRSVVDRLQQIEPRVLLVVDGYRYGDKAVDRRDEVAAIRAALPSLEATVLLPYLDVAADVPDAVRWDDLLGQPAAVTYEQVPFDHPLYVLYSSGTTGLPKPIVHGHGGITVEHAKALALHQDLGPGDRFFWFSTTGWMMWNYLVSAPMVGASIVMFDGNPGHPDLDVLWRLVEETGTTWAGLSAPFLMACRKEGLRPGDDHDLAGLRGVGSTGAPLPAAGFAWVYDAVGSDLVLASISGGTDVCTAFVGAAPLVPVRSGRIPCRLLGCAVEAWNEDGEPVVGEVGELVITSPMPSMPVAFWGDDDGSRYADAYFDTFPGVWRHGDWVEIGEDGSLVISGRSDATLNRGGVRIGTAEFYAALEAMPEVESGLVVHLEDDEGGMGELVLFVALTGDRVLDEAFVATVRRTLREELSPRHVPDRMLAVPAIPRTLSGKKLEVPVKRLLRGADVDRAVSRGALANPEAVDALLAVAEDAGLR